MYTCSILLWLAFLLRPGNYTRELHQTEFCRNGNLRSLGNSRNAFGLAETPNVQMTCYLVVTSWSPVQGRSNLVCFLKIYYQSGMCSILLWLAFLLRPGNYTRELHQTEFCRNGNLRSLGNSRNAFGLAETPNVQMTCYLVVTSWSPVQGRSNLVCF